MWVRHRSVSIKIETHGPSPHCLFPRKESFEYFSGSHRNSTIALHVEILHTTTRCNTLQHITTHCHKCNTLQHIATHCNTRSTHSNTLQHTPTHSNTLQHTAKHCNTLQHIATHCNTLQHATHTPIHSTTLHAHLKRDL